MDKKGIIREFLIKLVDTDSWVLDIQDGKPTYTKNYEKAAVAEGRRMARDIAKELRISTGQPHATMEKSEVIRLYQIENFNC